MQRSIVWEQPQPPPLEQTSGWVRPVDAAGSSEIADVWRILWFRRAWIIGAVAICGIGTLIYLILTPLQFTATAQILVDPRDRQIVTKDVTPDTLAADGGTLQVDSQSRVIESDAVLLRAIRSLGLGEDPDFGLPKTGFVASLLDLVSGIEETAGPAANDDRALRALRKHLAVKRADKVFVIDVVVTAYSGPKAARIADAIAEAYLADQVQSRADSSARASDALTSRLAELRGSVKSVADQIERYKVDHDLLGTDKQLISDQQLSDNGSQLDTARAKVTELQARADQVDALQRSGGDGGAIQEAIQSSVITALRASLSELTRRRSDMRTRFGDRYPDLIAIDAEIQQAHLQIKAEIERLVHAAHSDLDRAKKNEQALLASLYKLKLQTISSDQASVTLQELNRELDARRSIYQAFLARAGETREQSNIDNTNARIISRAIPPVQPSWPLRAILLLGSIGGGIGLGMALAFTVEYAAPTILSPKQLESAVNAPVVGIVSAGSSPAAKGGGRPRRGNALELPLSRLCGPLGALKHRPRPRTVLVASGRSFTRHQTDISALIVSAAANSGVAVLLIETKPVENEAGGPGLLNIMNGECSLKSVVTQDAVSGIHYIGIGTSMGRGRESVTAQRFDPFLDMAGRTFDLLVFDGGCFVDNLGTASLAACVDDILLVALRGTTPQKEAAETADAVAASTGRPVSAALLVDPLMRI